MMKQNDLFLRDAAPAVSRPEPARRRAKASPGAALPAATERGAMRRWRTIWLSDVHLGTRACRSAALLEFLRHNESENLYLVGDIVDGWELRRSFHWHDEHNRILEAILERSSRGTRVSYVTGNHDEFLRRYAGLMLGGIALKNEAVHRTADGRELLVTHGDEFDPSVRHRRWLGLLGERAYRACARLSAVLDGLRRPFGLEPWSLAEALKRRVKNAVAYVSSYEQAAANAARRRGFDGIVCGHIHQPELRVSAGFVYANTGDWVEHCSALVEDHAGRLGLLRSEAGLQRKTTAALAQ